MPDREIAHTQPFLSDMTDAFGMRAVAMRRQRVNGTIAAAAMPHVTNERASGYRFSTRGRRAEESRLSFVEAQRDGYIVTVG
ncbi:hypothetical protein GCM10011488_11080 [Steroidobacter agaridevorans]|nr:hypothetical protein GCM10011488_11080 [Steroidobacter agaridevorans]